MLLVVCRSRSVEECAINLFKNHIILAEIHWYEQRRTLSNVHPSENSLLYNKKTETITDQDLKKNVLVATPGNPSSTSSDTTWIFNSSAAKIYFDFFLETSSVEQIMHISIFTQNHY